MTDFETSSSLRIELDQASVHDAKRQLESSIGSVTVDARADGGRSTGGGGGMREIRSSLADSLSLDEDRNNLLEDIYDELDEAEFGGGGGGVLGGGDGGGPLSRAVNSGIGGAAGGAASGAAAGTGSTLAAGATTIGAGAVGAGLGLGGVNLLDRAGALDRLNDLGGATRDRLPFGEQIGDASQFLPGLANAAQIRPLASGASDLLRGDFGGARESAVRARERFNEVRGRRRQTIGNVAEPIAGLVRESRETFEETSRGPFDNRTLPGVVANDVNRASGGALADGVDDITQEVNVSADINLDPARNISQQIDQKINSLKQEIIDDVKRELTSVNDTSIGDAVSDTQQSIFDRIT